MVPDMMLMVSRASALQNRLDPHSRQKPRRARADDRYHFSPSLTVSVKFCLDTAVALT
jgi:hypothetical protein